VFINKILREWKEKGNGVSASGGDEDGYSAGGDSRLLISSFCVQRLLSFSSNFLDDEGAKKMMQMPTFCGK
jgi:hypothetical protein